MDDEKHAGEPGELRRAWGHRYWLQWVAMWDGDRNRAACELQAIMAQRPAPKPVTRSFAGTHLNWEGRAALEICRLIATANPGFTDARIARKAANVLLGKRCPPRPAIVAVTWAAERLMPRLADRETGTVTTRCSPNRVEQLRRDIEATFGPILQWTVTAVQEGEDEEAFSDRQEQACETLERQLRRLLEPPDRLASIS